jgi:hypoxanthine-DNA glycosylase
MARNDEFDASVGFPPIAREDARVLILGSLPSQASLMAHEYYAHPQNAFWKVMRELTGAEGSYAARCESLRESGIAVWDVLASSVRPGSMDADIRMDSAAANDFASFISGHTGLQLVCFNGKKAAQMFRRLVELQERDAGVRFETLPSTSPAYAALSFEQKLRIWRGIIGPEIDRGTGNDRICDGRYESLR